jgi:hypothetical protein
MGNRVARVRPPILLTGKPPGTKTDEYFVKYYSIMMGENADTFRHNKPIKYAAVTGVILRGAYAV